MSVQVAWATFAGMDGDRALCMLQLATLTTYSLKGELHTVTLPTQILYMNTLHHVKIISVRPRTHLNFVPDLKVNMSHAHNAAAMRFWILAALPTQPR